MAEFLIVYTTAGSAEEAESIARAGLEPGLAACAQIEGPLTSLYWWKGKLQRETEWRCVFKTRAALYPRLEGAIRAAHPYETPEIIALPITAGSAGYLAWMQDETKG
jgi:periplasmic divalent cation tolerance protein